MLLTMGARTLERKRYSSKYIQEQIALASQEVKQDQRDRVLNHFGGFISESSHSRVFTFPSASWAFEDQMLRRHPNISFVAVERLYDVIRHSVPMMPGDKKINTDWSSSIGTIYGYHSTKAIIAWCECSTWLGMSHKEGVGLNEYRRNYSAAWLDFTSPLTSDSIRCMKYLPLSFSRKKPVPFAVTFLVGRERTVDYRPIKAIKNHFDSPLESRVEIVRLALNKWGHRESTITEAWKYQSRGVVMGMVTGVSSPK